MSLEVAQGEIIGLLGADGAGKTTLLKLLSGLLEPTEGQITVSSHNPWTERDKVLKHFGILIEIPVFYEHLTAYVLRPLVKRPIFHYFLCNTRCE